MNNNQNNQKIDIENILNNTENKLIFLKAILLGISYGKSTNCNFYIQTINNEINNISNNNSPELKNCIENIKKYELNIIELENKKNIILSNIKKLTSNNYAYNHSRINILKLNLNQINIEINKIKYYLFKANELKNKLDKNQISIKDKKNKLSNRHSISVINNKNNLVNELEQTLDNLSNLFI
jgi:hypothetical protein